jgi:ketosteroid isomerase-like protein
MNIHEAEALVRELLDGIAARDRDKLGAMLADDARWWWPASVSARNGWPRPVVGRDEILMRLAPDRSNFTDGTTTWTILELVAGGDGIAACVERAATQADGTPYRVEYVFVMRCRDGQLVEVRDALDTLMAVQGG